MSRLNYVSEILTSRRDDNEIRISELKKLLEENSSEKGLIFDEDLELKRDLISLEDEIKKLTSVPIINAVKIQMESKSIKLVENEKKKKVIAMIRSDYMFELHSIVEENQEIGIALEELFEKEAKKIKEPSTEFGDSRTLSTNIEANH